MRAREWAVVDAACEPAEYGIPELPTWRVSRDDDGGLAFAAEGDDEPFIAAESPVRVRR
jgi:hypothetical protein